MLFKRHTGNGGSFLALFDIGATSVGVSLSRDHQGAAELLWHVRLDYGFKAQEDYAHYERSMFATLLEVGMRLMSEGVRKARDADAAFSPERMRVVCVLAPPWFFGSVGVGAEAWDKPTVASEELLASLSEKAKQQAQICKEADSWRAVVGDSQMLETIPQIQLLNGYPVREFSRQPVTSASVSLFCAEVGTEVYAHIAEILARVLPNHDPIITSSTNLLSRLYRSTMGAGSGIQGFLVEVGGQVTSIASITAGVLSDVGSIPYGTNDMLNAAAPKAASAEEARGVVAVIQKGMKNEGDTALPENLQNAIHEWRDEVFGAFKKQSHGMVPLESVFIMAPAHWYDLLIPALKVPWVMPGIREEHAQVVTPVSLVVLSPEEQHQQEGSFGAQLTDSRLQVFAHSVFYSTAH